MEMAWKQSWYVVVHFVYVKETMFCLFDSSVDVLAGFLSSRQLILWKFWKWKTEHMFYLNFWNDVEALLKICRPLCVRQGDDVFAVSLV